MHLKLCARVRFSLANGANTARMASGFYLCMICSVHILCRPLNQSGFSRAGCRSDFQSPVGSQGLAAWPCSHGGWGRALSSGRSQEGWDQQTMCCILAGRCSPGPEERRAAPVPPSPGLLVSPHGGRRACWGLGTRGRVRWLSLPEQAASMLQRLSGKAASWAFSSACTRTGVWELFWWGQSHNHKHYACCKWCESTLGPISFPHLFLKGIGREEQRSRAAQPGDQPLVQRNPGSPWVPRTGRPGPWGTRCGCVFKEVLCKSSWKTPFYFHVFIWYFSPVSCWFLHPELQTFSSLWNDLSKKKHVKRFMRVNQSLSN